MPTWPSGRQLLRQFSKQTDTVFLAFSAGKDSLAAWLEMQPHFQRIIPVYKYLIPNLEFIERGLRYYEWFFKTEIIRVPHDSLYRMLKNYVFQPPERWPAIMDAELREPKRGDDHKQIAQQLGIPVDTWTAIGTRAADSPQRRMSFVTRGPVNQRQRTFCPVWDMNKATLLQVIREAGVRLPPEYRIFGRSFDGIDFRFMYGIKKHFPEDYQRILDWFPLAELEIKRYEFAQKSRSF